MPFDKTLYPPDWFEIRERIRARDGDRCAQCHAPNHTLIWRGAIAGIEVYGDPGSEGRYINADTGELAYEGDAIGEDDEGRHVYIVLTCAHMIDPNPMNCDPGNLAMLCQRCHNRLDAPMRRANAAITRRSRKALGDLF